ncbi:MAG: hypothetical protein CM1200mP34_0450 [Verrucomicrobiales bacterium]|nr:MAG: hypothetical protein CM1200mP34_0450 [Verrucomicrobiales bacterium]
MRVRLVIARSGRVIWAQHQGSVWRVELGSGRKNALDRVRFIKPFPGR